ncbi:hypothetical protein IPA_07740 [Ignicoccus pacificus DSM 13166]|uniref:Uncharacterized protein n=1 Tax=Ignicoccus pacificus DSM 13166 TaxID=940294 RepID=A0A977KD53_9CREN|nr:hypothetical protein IPA_07740 [Ignicoccus pacificus DSM 13166]
MHEISLYPLGMIASKTVGERLPFYPGPGATRHEITPLFRIETFFGALANEAWSSGIGGAGETWEELVLSQALKILGIEEGVSFCGPFLAIGKEVYANVYEGLLKVAEGNEVSHCLDEYLRLTEWSEGNKSDNEVSSLRYLRRSIIEKSELRKKLEKKCLIKVNEIAKKTTHVALNPYTKTADSNAFGVNAFGMLHSLTYLDFHALSEREAPRVIVLVNKEVDFEGVLRVGPRSSFYYIKSEGKTMGALECLCKHESDKNLIIAETPLDVGIDTNEVVGHPLSDPYISHFRTYEEPSKRERIRELPRLALRAGAIVKRRVVTIHTVNGREVRVIRSIPIR